ncbi:putative dual-specificity RNA methyltransferase RlmN [Bacteroidia bacterium]|nr:putative dual-specificity RNA methyltransferase RlmN [Bacteroidia bacterium]
MYKKIQLFGLTLSELHCICKDMRLPSFTARQLCDWLYKKRITSIDEMTNLSLKSRVLLQEHCELGLSNPIKVQQSQDGTKKYLFSVGEDHTIETVYMPGKDRHTLCVSSQVGCRMGCQFCATGQQGFADNLTAGDILNQVRSIQESEQLTNIVYMGMGEPFDNTDEVLKSLEILTSDWGYAWSPRRINVSTVGIVPDMVRFIEQSQCHLAISLHSPFDYERQKMMPVQNKYPLKEVFKTLKNYNWSQQRRLSFEYIMFAGINDTSLHVDALCKQMKGLFCRINLIKFHDQPGQEFQACTEDKMIDFRDKLNDRGIIATIRQSRGEDILAACGLLATLHNKTVTYDDSTRTCQS